MMSLLTELERAKKSRKVPKFSFGEGVVCLSHELVELAGGGIAFHLLVPFVVLERMPQRFQFATLLQRKIFDRIKNFSNRAHAGKLSAMRFGVNAAKLDLPQRRGGAEKITDCLTGGEFN